jgi:hypothetical protein
MARGERRSPPFMLRAGGQLTTFLDGTEQLGRIREIVWPHRRRVIDTEPKPDCSGLDPVRAAGVGSRPSCGKDAS